MNHREMASMLDMFLSAYLQGARRSGRTTAMVNGVKPEDTVFVPTSGVQRHVHDMLRKRGVEAYVVVASDGFQMMRLAERIKPGTSVHFDHTMYEAAIRKGLDEMIRPFQVVVQDTEEVNNHTPPGIPPDMTWTVLRGRSGPFR